MKVNCNKKGIQITISIVQCLFQSTEIPIVIAMIARMFQINKYLYISLEYIFLVLPK